MTKQITSFFFVPLKKDIRLNFDVPEWEERNQHHEVINSITLKVKCCLMLFWYRVKCSSHRCLFPFSQGITHLSVFTFHRGARYKTLYNTNLFSPEHWDGKCNCCLQRFRRHHLFLRQRKSHTFEPQARRHRGMSVLHFTRQQTQLNYFGES